MISERFSFPHPVLGNADDISGEIQVGIKINRDYERSISFEIINFKINNDYFESLINRKIADCFLKIYCSSTVSTWVYNLTDNIKIDEDLLANRVEVQVYILANNFIDNYTDITFNSQYGGFVFAINKGEVIGITGKITLSIPKIDEEFGLGNIFKFYAHTDELPVQFEYNHSKIYIKYPVSKAGEHPPALMFSKAPWTALNIFILPAIAGALKYIEEECEEASELDWYSVIEFLMPEESRTGDYYTDAQYLIQNEIPLLLAYEEFVKNDPL